MSFPRFLLPGLLVLVGTTHSRGQSAPATTAPTETAPNRLLLKVGLNAGRAIRYGGYQGLTARLPLSAGAEYALSSKFTLYGQVDADFSVFRHNANLADRNFILPAGAVGLGGRYYYNQAGRARHNRAHGQFVGNYLGLEAHAEMRRLYDRKVETMPSLNLLWGMQRRINRSLLFDINAGVGAGASYNRATLGLSPAPFTLTTQLNASLYFGR